MENIFIDIERFAEFVNKNPSLFRRKGSESTDDYISRGGLGTDNTANSWKQFEKLSKKSIEEVNKHLEEKDQFKIINIGDFILCINMAKDHNRGNNSYSNTPISSTGKKVLLLLLLGRSATDDFKKSALVCRKETDSETALYKHLSKFAGDQSVFYYFPGRAVTFAQLNNMASTYKNRITSAGIKVGVAELVKRKLVIITEDKIEDKIEDKPFKLNFDGCYEFLQKSKESNEE